MKLIVFQFILIFGNRCSLQLIYQWVFLFQCIWGGKIYSFNNIVNQFFCFIYFFFGIGYDEIVEIFFLVIGVSGVRMIFVFFYGVFVVNCNFGVGFCFYFFEGIVVRVYE